ncbi:DNA-binding response regulator, NarL/FixJ family, contains REC and HTH domains [Streptomyces sp. 2323.1]|uniref:response regulator n=1 Tax=Streptomyces sp. 2323.1 TaxID=1938841 RepID=UPI000BB87622|nr:response regulator transcription factor [Streptomyces sp. 2323.1]SOE15851.1 DNA-binding response regulator, NarL/FixJ family, contains REC and HTH domains [Streptomyces sp. 2323.1]
MHIMISDDARLLHDTLAPRLREHGVRVSSARSIKETLGQLEQGVAPDVILLDINFSRSGEESFGGLRVARTIRRGFPGIALIALSQHDEMRIALEMMRIGQQGGRVGYLLKDKVADVAELLECAETVRAGGICIDAELQGLAGRGGRLTHKQREVAELIVRGRTNKGIGEELRMAEGTVDRHIGAIRRAYELPSPDQERELKMNIRVLIVLAYLSDNTRHSDPE